MILELIIIIIENIIDVIYLVGRGSSDSGSNPYVDSFNCNRGLPLP